VTAALTSSGPPIAVHPDRVPVTGSDVASLEKRDKVSTKRIAQYLYEQYEAGLGRRKQHAIMWIMVRSILRKIHYFKVDGNGSYVPIPPTPGKPRAVTPVLVPARKRMLGFLENNPVGVTSIPLTGSSDSIQKANRARDYLNGWVDDVNFKETRSRCFRYLLDEGMYGLLPYRDEFRQNVFPRPIPGSQLFPVPHDASHPDELSWLIWAQMVPKAWLEQEDSEYEKKTGKPPTRRMQDKVGTFGAGMSVGLPGIGHNLGAKGKFNGAIALTAWQRKTPDLPHGQYVFMLGNEMFRHMVGPETERVMPGGEIPVSIAYWDKDESDFWGYGFSGGLVPMQLAMDRQMTTLETSARRNHSFIAVNTQAVNVSDLQDDENQVIQFNESAMATKTAPIFHFPAKQTGRDVGHVVALAKEFADDAAGFRSGIAFGQQEGRTEGGPATTLLAQNAMAPLVPSIEQVDRSLTGLYEKVLSLLPTVWPEEKFLRLAEGPGRTGRIIRADRNDVPSPGEVMISSRPMVPGGRNALLNILFSLTKVPGPDGKLGTELSPGELRRSLSELGVMPPGIDMANRPAARIETRINMLVGDGQKPLMRPSEPGNTNDRLVAENHRLSVEMIKDVILDESRWFSFGQQVQAVLIQQMRFHMSFMHGGTTQPNDFDNDMERQEMDQTEQFMAASEADPETPEGIFQSALGAQV
jgi:hypothetical protein